MSRQPWKDSPIGSRAFEEHEAKLRGQADLFDKDQHIGTMDDPPAPDTPESRARLAKLDAALEDIARSQAEANQDRTLNSYDQARLDNITAIGALEQELLEVINEARPHVYRQQYHGRHEQDRADAVAWLQKWTGQDHEGVNDD